MRTLSKGSAVGVAVLAGGGLALLLRGVTHLGRSRRPAVVAGRRAILVRKAITLGAPVGVVFDAWTRYEEFPRFMAHVREVRRIAADHLRWVVTGPRDVPLEWDTVITRFGRNRVLGWKTVEGTAVEHAGLVHFRANPDGSTTLDVELSYRPPAGARGHAAGALLGPDPARALDEDLGRLKSLLEAGPRR